MVEKLSLKDIPLNQQKVLMRVDFNVPLNAQGQISDDSRIRAALPSIRYVLDQGGALILMSHLGRPKNKPSPEFSLKPCAERLAQLLEKPVIMAPDCIGDNVQALAQGLKSGQILLLENLRFHPGEEHPEEDPDFVKSLAALGSVYVNDAFGTAHRAHASTTLIAEYFPEKAAAGFLLEKEIQFLGSTLIQPQRPFYAIIGGAKISTKIGVLEALAQKADALLIGGAMAYTFYKAKGISIGKSLCEEEYIGKAKDIIRYCQEKQVKLILPVDHVAVAGLEPQVPLHITETESIPADLMGVDIGPKTLMLFEHELQKAATVFWNGPLGIFEDPRFAKGTFEMVHVLSRLKCTKIIGGGDSVAAVEATGLGHAMTHLSTGGGAALEYIENGKLPGIEALSATSHKEKALRPTTS